jgi:hypothetical protein
MSLNQSVFSSQSLKFDTKPLDTTLVSTPLSGNINFGIVDFTAISIPLTKENLEFMFMIDRSGSMSDLCLDGRTKMQHIIHTISNIIYFLRENPTIQVFITVDSFDNIVERIVERTNITQENCDEIIGKIGKITARACTNIEKALIQIKKYSAELKEQFPSHKLNHIFLTDGQITDGKTNPEYLQGLIDPNIMNAFIGFGIDHDTSLLNDLSQNENSNYYFIDKLENAALIYGEILHGIIYKFLCNVVIILENGLIYNYKTNEWKDSLQIEEIVGESNKTFHVISSNPDIFSLNISGTKISDGSKVSFSIEKEENSNLTNYIYRQRTQQLLYELTSFLKLKRLTDQVIFEKEINIMLIQEKKKLLKIKLEELLNELKKYMEDNDLKDNIFLKNLSNDLYICLKTFNQEYGEMYSRARMLSQGLQRAYTASHTPHRQNVYVSEGLSRQNSVRNNDDLEQDDYDLEQDDYDLEQDDYEIYADNHDISDCTPYRSSTQTQVIYYLSNTNDNENTQII